MKSTTLLMVMITCILIYNPPMYSEAKSKTVGLLSSKIAAITNKKSKLAELKVTLDSVVLLQKITDSNRKIIATKISIISKQQKELITK